MSFFNYSAALSLTIVLLSRPLSWGFFIGGGSPHPDPPPGGKPTPRPSPGGEGERLIRYCSTLPLRIMVGAAKSPKKTTETMRRVRRPFGTFGWWWVAVIQGPLKGRGWGRGVGWGWYGVSPLPSLQGEGLGVGSVMSVMFYQRRVGCEEVTAKKWGQHRILLILQTPPLTPPLEGRGVPNGVPRGVAPACNPSSLRDFCCADHDAQGLRRSPRP